MACPCAPGAMCYLRYPDMGVKGNRDSDDVRGADGM